MVILVHLWCGKGWKHAFYPIKILPYFAYYATPLSLGSRFEIYEKRIFSSAFELDKVALDPDLRAEFINLAIQNHAECVHVYEEVRAVPKEIWDQLCSTSLKTWLTFCWSLSWANVDAASLIEQETKAGFWDQEIQAIYDSLFPNNPTAIRSLSMEDWEMFISPWASSHSEEEVRLG